VSAADDQNSLSFFSLPSTWILLSTTCNLIQWKRNYQSNRRHRRSDSLTIEFLAHLLNSSRLLKRCSTLSLRRNGMKWTKNLEHFCLWRTWEEEVVRTTFYRKDSWEFRGNDRSADRIGFCSNKRRGDKKKIYVKIFCKSLSQEPSQGTEERSGSRREQLAWISSKRSTRADWAAADPRTINLYTSSGSW